MAFHEELTGGFGDGELVSYIGSIPRFIFCPFCP
jgi:hypothetical protein